MFLSAIRTVWEIMEFLERFMIKLTDFSDNEMQVHAISAVVSLFCVATAQLAAMRTEIFTLSKKVLSISGSHDLSLSM